MNLEDITFEKPELTVNYPGCSPKQIIAQHNAIEFVWPGTEITVSWGNSLLIIKHKDEQGFDMWALSEGMSASVSAIHEIMTLNKTADRLALPTGDSFGDVIRTARKNLKLRAAAIAKFVFDSRYGAPITDLENNVRKSLTRLQIVRLAYMLKLESCQLEAKWKKHGGRIAY